MVLWLSTDFGDFPIFWWGGPLKSGVSSERTRNLQLTINMRCVALHIDSDKVSLIIEV